MYKNIWIINYYPIPLSYTNQETGTGQNPNTNVMLVQDKKVNEIFETTNYSRFKMIKGNRKVEQSHVKNLSRKMKTNGWLKTSEMTVNEKFEIIDGQHRYLAAQIAGIPVRYKIVKKSGIVEVRQSNQSSRNWTLKDHIPSYVSLGNQNYIDLSNFSKRFPNIKITDCMMLLSNSMSSPSREVFESGEWKVKNYDIAVKWGNHIMSLKPFFEGYNRAIFVRGLIKVLSTKSEFSFDEFYHKVKLRPKMLVPCGTTQQYIELIEEIYNYKRKVTQKLNLRY